MDLRDVFNIRSYTNEPRKSPRGSLQKEELAEQELPLPSVYSDNKIFQCISKEAERNMEILQKVSEPENSLGQQFSLQLHKVNLFTQKIGVAENNS